MSRSIRRPYSAICGAESATWDKTTASRDFPPFTASSHYSRCDLFS